MFSHSEEPTKICEKEELKNLNELFESKKPNIFRIKESLPQLQSHTVDVRKLRSESARTTSADSSSAFLRRCHDLVCRPCESRDPYTVADIGLRDGCRLCSTTPACGYGSLRSQGRRRVWGKGQPYGFSIRLCNCQKRTVRCAVSRDSRP